MRASALGARGCVGRRCRPVAVGQCNQAVALRHRPVCRLRGLSLPGGCASARECNAATSKHCTQNCEIEESASRRANGGSLIARTNFVTLSAGVGIFHEGALWRHG